MQRQLQKKAFKNFFGYAIATTSGVFPRQLSTFSKTKGLRGSDGRLIAFAFDIDGVLLRSGTPIGNSQRTLQKIIDHPSSKFYFLVFFSSHCS